MRKRINSYTREFPAIATWLRQVLFGAGSYQPARHYMRGPGPKWRAKHLAQYPDALRDKRD